MEKVKLIYSQFKNRGRVVTSIKTKSMTQQQFKDEADLNQLIDKNMRFKDPGFLTKLQLASGSSVKQPIYGDFTNVVDYQTALNTIRQAGEQFMSLPATVRAEFNNDPAKLMEFVHEPQNYERGVELGLFKPKEPQKGPEKEASADGVAVPFPKENQKQSNDNLTAS